MQEDTGHPLRPRLPLTSFSFSWRTLHLHPEGDVGRSGPRGHGRQLVQWLRRGWSSESDPRASTLHPPGRAGSSSSCERRKARTLRGSWRRRVSSLHPGHKRKFAQPHLGAMGQMMPACQGGRSALGYSGQRVNLRLPDLDLNPIAAVYQLCSCFGDLLLHNKRCKTRGLG